MIGWLTQKRQSPIGIDLGSRSVKLVQLSGDHAHLIDAARWDLPVEKGDESTTDLTGQRLAEAIVQVREGRSFRGHDAVVCLNGRQLFVQNIRVPKSEGVELARNVRQEAAGRISFPIQEATIRFIEAADVRQGDTMMREVVLFACHQPVLEQMLDTLEATGLCPTAVDVEPLALLRSYVKQHRREEDRDKRVMLLHVGFAKSLVVIAQDEDVLFVKYIDIAGRQMDQAVAKHLDIDLANASTLRRHNGDRRADQQDPEIAKSVAEALRPVVDRLANEVSMCVRYHSVSFRGHPLTNLIVGGGEATTGLVDVLTQRVAPPCELGDPLRSYDPNAQTGRRGQWDVATGLALREVAR